MTYSPPSSAVNSSALSREQAVGAFNLKVAPREWLNEKARVAIVSPTGFVVSASAAFLTLFKAKDSEALEARLARGEGPSARRLRHLAATLPVGEPRLEQLRVVVDKRPVGVNLRCTRVEAPGGMSWLLASVPALGASIDEQPAPPDMRAAPRLEASRPGDPDSAASTPLPSSRFLWTLDEEGRFGEPHPMLIAVVGANAPQRGESVEAFFRRCGLDGSDALARILGERQTFSGLSVEWPVSGVDRRRRVALSAAPLFGRQREFLGYRGFGVLGDEFEAAPVDGELSAQSQEGGPAQPEALEATRSFPIDVPEPKAHAHEIIGIEVESRLDVAPTDRLDAAPPPEVSAEANETGSVAQPAVVLRVDRPALDVAEPEAAAIETTTEPVKPTLEFASGSGSETTRLEETALEVERGQSASAPPEQDEPETPPTAANSPNLIDRSAASDAPPAPAERTAEIYVLRHPAPTVLSNIVPIRPGALDALARETSQSFPAESIELSRSERDAFKEIARALVGSAAASRDDHAGESAGADVVREIGIDARAEQPKDRPTEVSAAARGVDVEQIQRNGGAVLDRLPVGVLIARDGRALYANRTLLELIGYRSFTEFQTANGLSKMFRDRDPPGMATEDAGAVAIVKADGQILSVDGHAQVISWDGAPATLIALRRSLEAELRARMRAADSEALTRSGLVSDDLQAMLDRATDGAVTLESAGRILSLNEPAERLFGYSQNEIAGESLLMLLAPQSHPETTARLESVSRGGEAEALFRPLQVVGRSRDGTSIPLALTLARIGTGDAPQFSVLVRDLSREREAERRLIAARVAAEAASAAKTDFLAQVSHEIRTPLHAILGFAEVMLEERFGPIVNERYKDYIKDIHASGSHVMSLADDLLDLSKIEAGKLDLAFASVDANSVIRECVSLMQPQAARERVIMRVSLHDRLPRVMVDERSLKQIMLNLMSNAVKFNEPGGQVIVSTAVDASGQAVIRVRDTGVGMNENEVGLALTPFSQVGKNGVKGGAGLGLPLTKALVEANKAEFSIKSRREQGTLIEIAFRNIQAAQ